LEKKKKEQTQKQLITLEEVVVVGGYRGLVFTCSLLFSSLRYIRERKQEKRSTSNIFFFFASEACLINFKYSGGSRIIYAPYVSLVLFAY